MKRFEISGFCLNGNDVWTMRLSTRWLAVLVCHCCRVWQEIELLDFGVSGIEDCWEPIRFSAFRYSLRRLFVTGFYPDSISSYDIEDASNYDKKKD